MRLPLSIQRTAVVMSACLLLISTCIFAFAGPTRAAGLDTTLCKNDSTRLSIPSKFTVNACFDGTTLVLRNRTSTVLKAAVSGNVLSATRDTGAASLAAIQNTLMTEKDVIAPGGTYRVKVGSGDVWVQMEIDLDANRKYALDSLLLSYLPVVSDYGTIADFVSLDEVMACLNID